MPKKTTPKQKPRPSKEVLEMVKAAREKTANKRKREHASPKPLLGS